MKRGPTGSIFVLGCMDAQMTGQVVLCVCVCVYVLVDMSKGPGEAAGLRRPGACGGLEASWASALIFSRGTFCSGMGD